MSYHRDGLNDAGDFAGYAYLPENGDCRDFHIESFVSIEGKVTNFTVPGTDVFTFAYGMNNLGQVVGSYSDGNGSHGGFRRDADGTLTFPIDYPGAAATVVTGINDRGWMVGYYLNAAGDFHALFMQSPTDFLVYDVGQSNTDFSGINKRGFISGNYFDTAGVRTGFLARVRRSSDN
jgi:uncharacterized membrane protein